MFHFPRTALVGLMALVTAMAVTASRAEQKEKPKEPPPPFLRASFDFSACQKLVHDMGLPVPFHELRREFENEVTGAGALNTDKPIGAVLIPTEVRDGERFDDVIERCAVVALPVHRGTATLEALANHMVNRDDTAHVDGDTVTGQFVKMRRLADYVVASPSANLAIVKDNPFKDDYKKPGTLASATLDLAALRKHAPKIVDAFWESAPREVYGGDLDGMAKATVLAIRRYVDKIDTVAALYWTDETTLRSTVVISPINIKRTLPALPRPTFPAGTLGEVHIAYPTPESITWAPDMIAKIDVKTLAMLAGWSAEDTAFAVDMQDLLQRTSKVFLAADAISVSAFLEGNRPTILVVNQYSKAPDMAAELAKLAADANAARKKLKKSKLIETDAYMVGNQKVTRLLLLQDEQAICYMDVAQAGNKVAMTFSQGKIEKAAALLAAPTKGELKDLVTGFVNMPEYLKAVMGNMPMPDGMQEKLRAAAEGQTSTFLVSSVNDGRSMQIESTISLSFLKALGGVLTEAMGAEERMGPRPPMAVPVPPALIDQ